MAKRLTVRNVTPDRKKEPEKPTIRRLGPIKAKDRTGRNKPKTVSRKDLGDIKGSKEWAAKQPDKPQTSEVTTQEKILLSPEQSQVSTEKMDLTNPTPEQRSFFENIKYYGGTGAFQEAAGGKGVSLVTPLGFNGASTGALALDKASNLKSAVSTFGKGPWSPDVYGKLAAGTVYRYAGNAKSWLSTKNLLIAAGISLGAVSIAKDLLGTYPFAGFIGMEEASQTMGMGFWTAWGEDNMEQAKLALDMQDEILNYIPTLKDKIPILNVWSALERFRKTAQLKNMIDRELVRQREIQIATGETEDDKWIRIDKEREENRQRIIKEDEARYAQYAIDAAAAKAAGRLEDEKYYAKVIADKTIREAEDRKAEEEYYAALRKENAKLYDENRPSNLNFGLL